MDAHLFRLFAEHGSRYLEGALLEKLQEPYPGLLTFSLFNHGEKRQFVFHYGKQKPFCFFTSLRLPAGAHPSSQIMRIRKYFTSRRIAAVVFQYWQRKLWLMSAGQSQPDGRNPWLCLDFAKGPALFFLDQSEVPEASQPVWPDMEILETALKNWRGWLVLTPALRKTMARLEMPDQLALLRDLEAGGGDVFAYKKGNDLVQVSAWSLSENQAGGLVEVARADVLTALEEAGRNLVLASVYRRRESEQAERIKKKIRHFEKLLANLDKDEKKLRHMVAGEEAARVIQANLWRLDGTAHLDALILPGSEPVSLDRKYTVLENMRRLFAAASRGKRGLKILSARRTALLEEMGELNGVLPEDAASQMHRQRRQQNAAGIAAIRNLPRDVASFRSSDGFVMLRGKNAKGNAAVRRISAPHDLWAHVEQGQGAHVVIRRHFPGQEIPEKTLEEAGSLAASKSWLAGADHAAIMYAEIRHVKPIRKGGEGNVSIDRLAFTKLVPVRIELEERLSES